VSSVIEEFGTEARDQSETMRLTIDTPQRRSIIRILRSPSMSKIVRPIEYILRGESAKFSTWWDYPTGEIGTQEQEKGIRADQRRG
jgi:hypothetical protein